MVAMFDHPNSLNSAIFAGLTSVSGAFVRRYILNRDLSDNAGEEDAGET